MPDYRKVFTRTMWVYAIWYLVLPLSFAIKALFARKLNIVDYGLFFGLFAFFSIFTALRDFGLSSSSIYHVNKYIAKKDNGRIKTLFWVNQAFSVGIALAVIAIVFILKPYIISTVFRNEGHIWFLFDIFAIYWVIETVNATNMSFLNIFQEQKLSKLFDMGVKVAILGFSVIAFSILNDFQVPAFAYLTAIILSMAASSLFLFIKYRDVFAAKIYRKADLQREYLSFALIAGVGSIANILVGYADTFLTQFFLGATKVAYYTTAFSIAEMILLCATPLTIVTLPLFNRVWHEKGKAELSRVAGFVFNNLPLIVFPVALFFFIHADRIIYVIVGTKFAASVPILRFFSIVEVLKIFLMFAGQVVIAMGKVKKVAWIIVIAGIVNVAGDIILINLLGVTGGAIAMCITFLVYLALYFREIHKSLDIRIDAKNIVKIVLATAGFGITAYGMKLITLVNLGKSTLNDIVNSAIAFVAAIIVYAILLYALRVLSREKIAFLKATIRGKA